MKTNYEETLKRLREVMQTTTFPSFHPPSTSAPSAFFHPSLLIDLHPSTYAHARRNKLEAMT